MHDMTQLKEMLEKELGILAMEDKISLSSLDKIHKLTDTIKNIDKIEMLEGEEGYSQRGGYSRNSYDGRSYDDMSYDGNSYARRKRDSMGRYSRDEYARDGRSNRGDSRYSRDDGKEEMIEHLEDMMSKATSEKERQAFQRCITAIENG